MYYLSVPIELMRSSTTFIAFSDPYVRNQRERESLDSETQSNGTDDFVSASNIQIICKQCYYYLYILNFHIVCLVIYRSMHIYKPGPEN